MSLTKQQHLQIMQEIFLRLSRKCMRLSAEYHDLRYDPVPGGAVVGFTDPVVKFINISHAYTQITEASQQIRRFEQMIEELKNPPIPPEKLTEEDRFSRAVGMAVEHKLDISEIVASISQ